jgi:4-amino-4-deoxy-L-arabinose transferase-like glycosyltransferase
MVKELFLATTSYIWIATDLVSICNCRPTVYHSNKVCPNRGRLRFDKSIFVCNIVITRLSLPHKVATYGVLTVSETVRSVRAVSILFFGLCVVALYRVLKRWHSDQVAFLATTLFATNAITLAVGRLAMPLVLILGWSVIIALLLWLQHGNSRRVAPFILIVISAGLLYVPGAPYFFILLLLLFGNKILSTIRALKRTTFYFAIVTGILVIAPLIFQFLTRHYTN